MEYIKLTKENLDAEHICCAISNNRDIQVASKKAWLAERLDEGLVFLSSPKKKPFLADPKYLKYKGFTACDESDNGILLMYLPFSADAPAPRFRDCAKHPHVDEPGFVLYYTSQCPFNAKYVPIVEATAKENGIPFRAIRLESREEAQNAPTPITTYALFYNGKYLTNEQMNDAKFLKLVGSLK